LNLLDSGFCRNDGKIEKTSFYETINFDDLVKSLLNCHCEESFGYAQDKLHDEAISQIHVLILEEIASLPPASPCGLAWRAGRSQ